jgi:hypothetical protein
VCGCFMAGWDGGLVGPKGWGEQRPTKILSANRRLTNRDFSGKSTDPPP